ncbi:hypothetical protein E2C01_049538 [Portunus trituberculatus]|uniref:Uncharacterized protein n=1 Tax=Portunus trituberculatus TaxID=210409 RepID=A0A5B7GDF3_PORTR|nr:hypothetical protein [Portunus trituberculatus]
MMLMEVREQGTRSEERASQPARGGGTDWMRGEEQGSGGIGSPPICACQVVDKSPHPPHLVGDIMGVVGEVGQTKGRQGKEFRLT